MSYPPPPQQGQNSVGVPRQNAPGAADPRTYQYRPIQPTVHIDPPTSRAPTFGQYIRSDYRTGPGEKTKRWAGLLSFWLGLLSIPLLYIGGGVISHSISYIAAGISVVAIFFGLVAFIAGIGRVLGFFGIVLGVIGNIYILGFFLKLLNG
jgi:hypothetical protein